MSYSGKQWSTHRYSIHDAKPSLSHKWVHHSCKISLINRQNAPASYSKQLNTTFKTSEVRLQALSSIKPLNNPVCTQIQTFRISVQHLDRWSTLLKRKCDYHTTVSILLCCFWACHSPDNRQVYMRSLKRPQSVPNTHHSNQIPKPLVCQLVTHNQGHPLAWRCTRILWVDQQSSLSKNIE